MKRFASFVGVVVLSLLSGCGVEQTEEALTDVEAPLAETSATALDAETRQALAESCQPTSTHSCVNAGYGSCLAWSEYYDCGSLSACTSDASCRVCEYDPQIGRPICFRVPGQLQPRNRYRVCFNAAGQSCTEFEQLFNNVCGACYEPVPS
ncbi:hypothetical protein [Myxococcus sp. Y35]|uniref:hypothetical protein n=1 Tax=Pseudomyxococcus flavus TaxID=3115648 RepID=UPI003CF485E0